MAHSVLNEMCFLDFSSYNPLLIPNYETSRAFKGSGSKANVFPCKAWLNQQVIGSFEKRVK
jgi:hypothetical protein